MATKRELRDRASALAATLGVEVQTDRFNHEQLTALVADLEAKATGATAAQPESAPESPVPAAEPEIHTEPEAPVAEVATLPPDPPTVAIPEAAEPTPAVVALREREAAASAARKAATKYVVAPGRALYCARAGGAGLRGGEPIRSTDFSAARLDELLAQGAIEEA
jgi:hypothetical protein